MSQIAYSELELRYARPIAEGLIGNVDFRAWMFSETRHASLAARARHDAEAQRRTRNRPTMRNPYWFNYWCGKDKRCICRVGTAVESDILLVFECLDGPKLAVHVEVKRPGDTLGSGQAETYPKRAACWSANATRPRQIPPHDEYLTILACGPNLASSPELVHFDRVVFHDDIARYLSPYPET